METALLLVKEGAKVTICARSIEDLKAAATRKFEETGTKVHYVEADVTKEEACARLVASTVEKYGRLDIVVNNAGTAFAKPFEKVETDLWQQDFDLKLFGAIHCSRYAIPHMREVGGGAIINVTAAMAKTPPASYVTGTSVNIDGGVVGAL